jgi:DNA-binding SARP family transcriptional activator
VLEIQFLGQVCVVARGRRVEGLRNPRLLAYLVMNGDRTLRREEVAFALWPDSSDAQALTNLRRELHALRHTLPDVDDHLTIDHRTIRWRTDTPSDLDVSAFESDVAAVGDADRLRAGIERYRGDFLPGIYDDWVVSLRQRLRSRFVEALGDLAKSLESRRDYGAAMSTLRRLIALDPLDEGAYRRLIRVAAAAGDRSAGLQAYHACVTVLNDELGVTPTPETEAAFAALLAADRLGPVTPRSDPRSAHRLVGRAGPWRDLLAAVGEARAGRPTVALLTGEPGIGKSRLAEELVRWVRTQGVAAAYARCYAAEGALAYAAPTTWLRTQPLREALPRLGHAWLSEVARLVPELLVELPDLPAPAPMTEAWQRPRLFDALTAAVRSTSPAVLVLDDANWSDDDTLEWIHYLLRAEPPIPVLVLIAVRSEDVSANDRLSTLILDVRDGIGLREVELHALSADETLELGAEIAGRALDPAERSVLLSETEGHPLLVVELARGGIVADVSEAVVTDALPEAVRPNAPGRRVPARMRAVIVARLAQLSSPARRLVELAAAFGRDFGYDVMAAASDLEESELVAALDELWQRRLVRERGPNRYDLVHDRIRDVAYGEIPPARRRLLHRRIAQALELTHGADLDTVAALLAAQLDAAGLSRRAGDMYERAAEVAMRVSAFGEAARHLSRALALLEVEPPSRERDEREIALLFRRSPAIVAMEGYVSPRAEAAFERARVLAEQLGRARDVVRAMSGAYSVAAVAGRTDDAIDIADRAAARLTHPDDEASAYVAIGGAYGARGDIAAAIAAFRAALQGYRPGESRPMMPAGTDPAVFGSAWGSHALWLNGRASEAMSWSTEAIRRAEALDHPYALTIAHAYASILAQLRDDTPALMDHAAEVRGLCERYDFAYYAEWPEILVAWARRESDDGAAERIDRAIGRLSRLRALLRRPYYLWLLADVHRAAGRRSQALATLDQALEAAEVNGEHWWTAEIHRAAGEVLDLEPETGRRLRLAYDTATEQAGHGLALRAAISLARRYPDRRPLLAGALEAAPGPGDGDRAAARALLDEEPASR